MNRQKAGAAAATAASFAAPRRVIGEQASVWPLPAALWGPIFAHLTGAVRRWACARLRAPAASDQHPRADLSDPLFGACEAAENLANLSMVCKKFWGAPVPALGQR